MRGSRNPHHLFAIVGAAVTDHQHFEILHGLEQDGTDRERSAALQL